MNLCTIHTWFRNLLRIIGVRNPEQASSIVHFTKSEEAVRSILQSGFVFVANPTGVAAFVLPENIKLRHRQPEQFGMISFRESSPTDYSERHCRKFGCYGLCVDRTWAEKNGAMPVQYLEKESREVRSFRQQLQNAAAAIEWEVDRYPKDSFRLNAFHNAATARFFGAPEYAALIEQFRFFGPVENAWQKEYRIPNTMPDYSIPEFAGDAVSRVTSGKGWPQVISVRHISPGAVKYFVSPRGSAERFRLQLPAAYKDHEIRDVLPPFWTGATT